MLKTTGSKSPKPQHKLRPTKTSHHAPTITHKHSPLSTPQRSIALKLTQRTFRQPLTHPNLPHRTFSTQQNDSPQQKNQKGQKPQGGQGAKVDPRLEKQRKREEEKRLAAEALAKSGESVGQDIGEKSSEVEKKEKQVRTWLMIHADMQIRTLTGPLEKRSSNNAERKKNRQDQTRDLIAGAELIEKLVPSLKNHKTKVWYRKFNDKTPPQLITFEEALALAKADGEWSQVAMLRSSSLKPAQPDNIKNVPDDGVLPVWSMNVRDFLEDLYEKDTVQIKGNVTKEISLNTTITPDDLQRKVQQAIEFLFEGNTVRLMCNSKTVAKLATWVDSNTYFTADEIKTQTTDAISTGKAIEIAATFNKGGKATFQRDVVETRLRGLHPQKEGEVDHAYKMRINALIDQEKINFETQQRNSENAARDRLKVIESKIGQNVDRLMTDAKKYEALLTTARSDAQKAQREALNDKSHADHKLVKSLKQGQYLPQFGKKINLLSKQIESINDELVSWRKVLADSKKGIPMQIRVQPYSRIVDSSGEELNPTQLKAAKKQAQDAGNVDFSILNRVVGGGRSNNQGDARDGDSAIIGGGRIGGDDTGEAAPADDADNEAGGQRDQGEVPDDEKLATRGVGKMSKKQLEDKKHELALQKMTPKERVQYLAGLMAKQTYGVIGDVVEVLGKVSTIMMMERTERKKNKITLDFDEIDPAVYAKLSNKDKKRYDSKMMALKADPNAGLKLEIQNAMELFHKGKYIYNDAILEQQTKKPFWCSHDGGSSPAEASQKSTLTLNIMKSALNDGKKM